MFRKLKHLTKELLVFLVIFSMVCWSVSLPLTHFIKNTKAAGGIELMSIDDGGSTPDVYLDSLNTPEAFLKIAIYETETGTNTLDSVTVQLDQAMNCSGAICDVSPFDAEVDLGSLSNASTSGISLWLDNGDGNFDSSADTLISATPSAWAILNNPCPPPDSLNNTLWQTTFSNLNLTIPALFASRLTVFVAASAAANLDASTLHKFMPIITQNGIDISTTATNPSISDFPSETCGWMFMPVTLGTEGGGGGDSAPLVISEIQTSGAGVNDECIEIYNRTDQTVNTSGIVLGYIASTTSSLSAWSATSTLDINIPAYSYYLIGKSGGVYDGGGADETYTEFSLDETGGFVGLIHPEYGIIDMVGYGALASPFLAEGASPAPAPSAGGSIERKAYPSSSPSTMIGGVDSARGNASDTNNNSADFILRDPSDPQNASSDPESDMMLTTERGIVLNEVLYNTASGDGWIEIYNASTTKDIVLTDYVVEIATTTATSTAHIYTIPALTLSSGGFALIEWNESGGTDDTDSSDGLATLYAESKLNMSTLGGDITLWNDSGAIVDYIQYGGSGKYNQANAVAAGKWASGDFIPGSNYNASIARQGTAGDDYDDSIDWMPMSSPSAGYPNTGGDSTAPTAVTNVVLTDSDVSNYGLNGLDIRVSWSPASANDSSFDRYALYILPNGTSLDTNQHTSLANLYGQYYYESGTASTSYAFTGGSGMLYDSAGNALGTGSYQAHVVAIDFSGNRSSAVSSPVATLTGEGAGEAGADTVDPMIDHMNIWEARAESDITLYARMGDDRDQCAIATSSIIWKIGNDAWANATTTACVLPAMIGNVCLRECTVSWPASGWDADTTIYYYLAAYDQAGNSTFLGMYPTTNETEARNSVYVDSVNNNSGIDFIATADWDDDGTVADISGTVLNESGTPLQDAFVMIEGVAAATATTTANGAFTFADNAIRHPWAEIKVLKSGYMSEMRSVARDSSGIEIRLFTGDMSVSTAGGNGIAWTAPMDGMMMSPINIACSGDCSTVPMPMAEMPIIISFFNQMDSSTINDTDASNAGSNIYVTSDGNTKIPGSVKYVYNESYGTSEARFYSSTNLSYNTFYMVVLTPNVNDINGNPIESNRTSGNYEFSFSTMADGTTMWDGGYTDFADGGMYMPPYVIGTNPTPGSYNIPLGAILTVKFSEPMDPTSISSAVTLYPPVSGTTISLDSATKQVATISHIDALAANTTYEIRVMGSAKSQLGVWMGDPSACGIVSPDACLANTTHYTTSFQTSAVNDETAPTISGSYPANNDGITNSSVVDVAVPSMEIGFSEAMNPSTITSQSITLKKGTVSIAGSANYDPMSNSAKFSPSSALTANSVYTLTASTSITDLSGNRLNISSGNNIINFKTGSSDTLNPEVLYANGDDYQIAITFSEPMNAAPQTDTDNWAYSVLNPANYYINTLGSDAGCSAPGSWSCSPALVSPYNTAGGNQVSGLSNITISYNAEAQTVELSGFDMCSGLDYAQCTDIINNANAVRYFQVFIDNVKDRSSNAITNSGDRADGGHANASRSPMQNSAITYGILGPMDNMGTIINMDTMGMFGAGAFPMNAMAGQSSMYMIDIPVTKALQDGMKIVLTFPTGFNVSSVAKDPYSPMNNDMNEWNGGVVTFDSSYGVGGVASTTTNTITIQLDIATTTSQLNTSAGPDGFIDFLHIDLKGIINSSIPKDFGTSGYTVDVKTKSSDGALLESITTMPFFLTEAGTNTLTVVVTAPDAGTIASTTTVFLGSPMTGPMEAVTTAFVNSIATSTFTNLPNAEFMIFTNPYITIGETNYMGKPMPEQVWLSASTTKTITLEKEGSGSVGTVNVYLVGNYSTGGIADNVDIFANSPTGFRVKTLTSVGSTNPNAAMYLTEGGWMIGIGPAMPMGPMAGPPPMPDWMSPQMINIVVGIEAVTAAGGAAGIGDQNPVALTVANLNNFQVGDAVSMANAGTVTNSATTTITAIDYTNKIISVTPEANWTQLPDATTVITSVRETSNGNNDGKILFSISTQSLKNIKGYVLDDSGNGIGNAEVYAYQPYGGMGGGHTTTDTSGKFTLKVGLNGVWTIGAFKPGLPNSKEKSVEARDDSAVTGGDADGNDTADILLNGTLITDVNSDNSGTNPLRFKLKRPLYTISGKVLNASGQAVAYAPVWAYQPTSWGHADTMADSSGNYILYVDTGTWRVEADAPGVGWLQYSPDITIAAASQSNINLRPAAGVSFYNVSGTITIDGSVQQFMPLRASLYDVNGNYQGRDYGASTDSSGQYTISLPAGTYRIDTWTPNYGEVELFYDQITNSPANITVAAATTTANITIETADLQTISIQFNNGQASQTGFLHVDEMDFSSGYPRPTGYNFSTYISGLGATTTIKLKAGKYYFFDLDIPGYGFYMPTEASRANSDGHDCIKVAAADRAVYFTLPDADTGTITVSGTVTDGTSSTSDAWVWLGNPSSHFHSGTQSDSGGNFSLTVPALSSGNYELGADKPGYMSPAPTSVSGTASSTSNTIILAANTLTISGYVYTDSNSNSAYTAGEGLPNAWVWAQETSTGQMTQAPADATGAYELGVTAGSWQVYAGADGYSQNAYRISNTKTAITVSGLTSESNKNIALSADSNWTMNTKSRPITPSSGGTVDDSGSGGTGVKITVPPNALGSDSSSGNMSIQDTSAVTRTTSADPLGGLGKIITATDNAGNAITTLDDYIDIEIAYYKADIANMNVVDYSKLKNLSLSYWDNSSDNWVSLSTTRKAYYKLLSDDTEWTLKSDNATTSQTGYQAFIDTLDENHANYYSTGYHDYKLVFTAKSNHLTVFGATKPKDGLLPSSPTGLAQSSGSGTSVGLSWTAVTTNTDASAITDLLGYEIYRSTDGAAYTQLNTSDIAAASYTDTTASAFTSYYYKATAADDGGNETALANSTALQVCSNSSVSNGTITSACAITCDSGYTQNGNSCASSGGGGGTVSTTYCSGAEYDEWQDACVNNLQYRNVLSRSPIGCTLTSSQESERTRACGAEAETAVEEIIAETIETVSEVVSTAKDAAQEFAQKIVTIASEATEVFKANVNSLLAKFGFKRNLAKEQISARKYVKNLIKNAKKFSKENEYALTNFIAYGTDTTIILGEGERAGVVNSYKSAFGKLPTAESEWNDVIKIANGRWPSETNDLSEANAEAAFEKIYLRKADRSNPHDDAAVTVIAYGLRPADRNLDSEKTAIKTFRHIYGYNPSSATAWDIVRAIAYSGATR